MKPILLSATAAALLLQLASANILGAPDQPADPPLLKGASVTIPYSELRTLWAAAHPGQGAAVPPKPPLPYLVNEANAQLQIGAETSVLEVKFQVEIFSSDWITVPLLGGDARLEKAEAGPGGAVIWRDGYGLLTHQPGKATVTLRLSLPGRDALAAGKPLAFSLGDAAVKRLQISGVPPELVATLNGQRLAPAAGAISLAGATREIALTLTAPEPVRTEVASKWRTEAQMLARQQEGRLHLHAKLFAHADAGSGLALSLRLPANASAVTVSGEDVRDWNQTRPDDRQRLLRVRFKTPDILDRELEVGFTIPVSPLAEQWIVPTPTATDGLETRALYVFVLADALELKAENLRLGADAQRSPAWMREEIGGEPFATAEGGAELVVRPHWLPTVATSEAVIREARSELRVVADGSFQTTASFVIRHQAPLALPLELPAEVELLSCHIDGQSVRPIRRENGMLEVNLPGQSAADGSSNVSLVYTGKKAALDPVSGKLTLDLTRTPLFIERLEWVISIPDLFEITAAEGNTQIASRTADSDVNPSSIALSKDLCRGERPGVELFYQRRGLDQ